ncbi:hypothetical protein CDAR_510861 [Caerostris darwini]|uniref:Uncharacterized protein n=1 Tax=Caerostris darwini TaxID=1538125 RepID=A0AAV4T8B6_9ARAC|nr:hypothetical protein CDAR_510861 [Caerostris darwini]
MCHTIRQLQYNNVRGKKKKPTELWSQGNKTSRDLTSCHSSSSGDPTLVGTSVFFGPWNSTCLSSFRCDLECLLHLHHKKKQRTRGESLSGQQTFSADRTKGGHCVAERQKKACVEKGV